MLLYRRLLRSIAKHGLRAAIVRSYQRLVKSLRNHGIGGTLSRAWRPRPPVLPPNPPLIHPFDRLHGTDTSGFIQGGYLLFDNPSGAYTVAYYGISPSTLMQALTELTIQHERFTFVDIGCGKGRALLIAARFPFRRLLGVDYSAELCAIARANLATQPGATERTTILTQDAATLVFPETPLLIFLYDPFLEKVLKRFLANLERQLRRSPRETYVLYAAADRYTTIVARYPFLRQIYDIQIPMSAEDAAVDRHGLTHEHYTLYKSSLAKTGTGAQTPSP